MKSQKVSQVFESVCLTTFSRTLLRHKCSIDSITTVPTAYRWTFACDFAHIAVDHNQDMWDYTYICTWYATISQVQHTTLQRKYKTSYFVYASSEIWIEYNNIPPFKIISSSTSRRRFKMLDQIPYAKYACIQSINIERYLQNTEILRARYLKYIIINNINLYKYWVYYQ